MLTKKMNLQFFAEDPATADSNPSAEPIRNVINCFIFN